MEQDKKDGYASAALHPVQVGGPTFSYWVNFVIVDYVNS